MMGSEIAYGKAGLRIRLLVALALALSAAGARAQETVPAPDVAKQEIDILSVLSDQHLGAVLATERCVARATHEELRTLCADMHVTHVQQLGQLRAWLAEWYSVGYEPQLTAADAQLIAALDSTAGVDFEIPYLDLMIRHQAGAIRAGEQCLLTAHHEELLDLCHTIVDLKLARVDVMAAMLCGWYGICDRDLPNGGWRIEL